ncbi:hypothetical protein ACVMGC_000335, partial [Bradyrhizobium barranii subsp. barranii]
MRRSQPAHSCLYWRRVLTGISGLGIRVWQLADDGAEGAAKSHADGVSGEDGQTNISVLGRMGSQPQDSGTCSARLPIDDIAAQRGHGESPDIPYRSYHHAPSRAESLSGPGGEHWRSDRAAGSSRTEALPPHRYSASDRAVGSGRRPFDDVAAQSVHGASSEQSYRSYRDAPSRAESSSRSGGEHWRSDRAAASLRTEALPPHRYSASDLSARPGKRRVDDVTAQSIHGASLERRYGSSSVLNMALRDIDRARDVYGFSGAVANYGRQLRMLDKPTFLQKAAADFRYRFVARLEEDIRAGESWSYAKTCNAVSGEAGGREGMEACKALAARVSRLDDALMYEVEDRALALLAVSFGRNSRVPECRRGAIRIAEFCCNESRGLRRQTDQ